MAKTFENVADASAVNFQLMKALTTMSIDDQPPASPPLSLLTIPFDIFVLLLRVCFDRRFKKPEHELLRMVFATNSEVPSLHLRSSSLSRTSRSATKTLSLQKGENAAKAMFQLREMELYMNANIDEVVQESRWRAVMQKDMASRHRKLMKRMDRAQQAVRQLEKLAWRNAARGLKRDTTTVATPPAGHGSRAASPTATFALVSDVPVVMDAPREVAPPPSRAAILGPRAEPLRSAKRTKHIPPSTVRL